MASDKNKRIDFFNKCRKKYDISFLIDTHCSPDLEKYWQSEWGYKAYFSSFSSNSRGVIILLKNSFEFEICNQISDIHGNFVILDVKCFNMRFTVAAIYGPDDDNPDVYRTVIRHIVAVGNNYVILESHSTNAIANATEKNISSPCLL